MAVFAPIPSASTITAAIVNPGDLRSWRRANRRSFISLCAQSFDWIDEGRAEQQWIVRRNLVKLRRQQTTDGKCSSQTNNQTKDYGIHSLPHNQTQHICRLRAERHAHTNLTGALFDGVSDGAINSNDREEQGDAGKSAEQRHRQSLLADRLRHDRAERARLQNWQSVIDPVKRRANNSRRCLWFGSAAHEDVEKRSASLRPRSIKFDVVRFGELLRTDIADYADHFRLKSVAVVGTEKYLVADRILVREKFLRGRLAQDHHER